MWKVIVVDDEDLVRKGIVISIDWKKLDCVLVGDASNASEALALCEKFKPDLIISDIKMPKMNGIEMLEELRENGSEIEVIFLTAYSDFEYAQNALRLYAADYLLKPFEDGELEAVITKVKNKKELKQEEISIENFELDLNRNFSVYTKKAISFVNENYAKDLNIAIISENLGISDGHLSRVFKRETNCTVMNYLTNRRMHQALLFLKDCRYKIYEVGEMVGYKDVNYFSSTFKKIVGVSPSIYQNRYL